jgi:hypothetical protein
MCSTYQVNVLRHSEWESRPIGPGIAKLMDGIFLHKVDYDVQEENEVCYEIPELQRTARTAFS